MVEQPLRDKRNRITLYAVLVRSDREDGRIKQTVIKYLGSIRQEEIEFANCRRSFWHKARQNLLTLDIQEQTMKTILSRLQKVVPEPSDDEVSERGFEVREKLRNLAR